MPRHFNTTSLCPRRKGVAKLGDRAGSGVGLGGAGAGAADPMGDGDGGPGVRGLPAGRPRGDPDLVGEAGEEVADGLEIGRIDFGKLGLHESLVGAYETEKITPGHLVAGETPSIPGGYRRQMYLQTMGRKSGSRGRAARVTGLNFRRVSG